MRIAHFKLVLLVVAAVGGLVIAISYMIVGAPKETAPQSLAVSEPKPAALPDKEYRGLPVQLKIPALGIDAPIEYVGDTPSGDMAVPSVSASVGWYKLGVLPGGQGSSVIAGHVVGPRGEPAIFINLNKLQQGDRLEVIDAKGQVATFTVRDKKTYDRTQRPVEVFNSSSGTHLNLITCAGEWDAAQRVYLKRLVVFTEIST